MKIKADNVLFLFIESWTKDWFYMKGIQNLSGIC